MGRGEKEEKTTKIAVVRCDIVSETCPAWHVSKHSTNERCISSNTARMLRSFGFFTCGGCPGRRIFRLVDSLMKHNVECYHLSSCMMLEKSYAKCPHIEEIKQMIINKGVKLVKGHITSRNFYAMKAIIILGVWKAILLFVTIRMNKRIL